MPAKRTMLLVCEEGEEEYDHLRFPTRGTSMSEPLRMQERADERNACSHSRKNAVPPAWCVEYNGMWQLTALFDEHAGELGGVSGIHVLPMPRTFLTYNANMREPCGG